MLRKLLIIAAVAIVPASSALARSNDHHYDPYQQHREDHREHRGLHRDQAEEHEEAHEEGFYNRREHKAYHRELRRDHNQFHDYRPNTRHDGYGRRYRYRGYSHWRGW